MKLKIFLAIVAVVAFAAAAVSVYAPQSISGLQALSVSGNADSQGTTLGALWQAEGEDADSGEEGSEEGSAEEAAADDAAADADPAAQEEAEAAADGSVTETGAIEAITENSITVNGREFSFGADTAWATDIGAAEASAFSVGMVVEVTGTTDETGALVAESVNVAAEGGEEAEVDERSAIEKFRDMDPRDIINEKEVIAEDMKTEPWNRDDYENFIPETGRNDPLTPVLDSIPEELRPERGGDGDDSDFQTYLDSVLASEQIAFISQALQVHNVIQIGYQKFASVSIGGGQRFTVGEGQGQQFGLGDGITISITFSSISSDEVLVSVSASSVYAPIDVSQDMVFIPSS